MAFTDNIITDYGAVADGQWASATLSITLGTKTLTSTTNLWSVGDVGKSIVIGEAGGSGPQGGSPLLTTITAFTDAKHITVNDNAGQTLTALVNTIVAWGTNNAGAFDTFKSIRAGGTGTLNIPSSGTGVYLVSSGNFGGLFEGVSSLTVNMTGATIAGGSFQLGSGNQQTTANHSARTISVQAGSLFVILSTPSQISRFTIGDYALMTGLCLQYGGYPSNHQRFEYCLVTAIDSDSGSPTYGKITFAEPLVNTYLSTWPLYDSSGIDYGGPSTLYAFTSNFNSSLTVNGGTFAHHAQTNVRGLNVVLNDCVFAGLYGPYPTMSKTSVWNRCTGLLCTMEIDKYVSNFTLNGCTWNGIRVQSTTPTRFILDNTKILLTLDGTSENTTIQNNSSVTTLSPTNSYGITRALTVNDSTVSNFGSVTFHAAGHQIKGGNSSDNGVNIDFTMSSGIITIPLIFKTSGFIEQWAVTGMRLFFYDPVVGSLGCFRIIDVTQDVTNVYIYTDWIQGGFPNRVYGVNQLWLIAHPASICTVRNSSGCIEIVDLSSAPAGVPLYSYTKRSYTGSVAAGNYWQMYGKISRINVIVNTPYTGATGTVNLTGFLGNLIKIGDFSDSSYAPTINLKAAGTRSLDCRSGYPAVWSGVQSGDSLANVSEALWMCSNQRMTMTDVSGQSSGTWPSFSIEIFTDQGINYSLSPSNLRLHS